MYRLLNVSLIHFPSVDPMSPAVWIIFNWYYIIFLGFIHCEIVLICINDINIGFGQFVVLRETRNGFQKGHEN